MGLDLGAHVRGNRRRAGRMADRQTAKAQSIMRVKLKYVDAFLNRKTGRTYAFFRRRGKRIPLPGLIGSPEFMAGYHACLRGEQPSHAFAEMTARTGPGTINAAVAQYLGSAAFVQLGEATCKRRVSTLRKFCSLVGDLPLAPLDRKYIERLLANMPTPIVART
jgi:hypothetical protein